MLPLKNYTFKRIILLWWYLSGDCTSGPKDQIEVKEELKPKERGEEENFKEELGNLRSEEEGKLERKKEEEVKCGEGGSPSSRAETGREHHLPASGFTKTDKQEKPVRTNE